LFRRRGERYNRASASKEQQVLRRLVIVALALCALYPVTFCAATVKKPAESAPPPAAAETDAARAERQLAERRQAEERAQAAAVRAPAKAAIVAIFDVQDPSKQFQATTLDQLTEYLASRVAQVARLQVVPRDQLRTRLAAEKRDSYKQCFDQSCQIELGKAMAAQKSLATKLLRVGTQCAMTANLYDLKKETVEKAATARTACSDDALMGGVDEIARQLALP
jgi:hypothetical protein